MIIMYDSTELCYPIGLEGKMPSLGCVTHRPPPITLDKNKASTFCGSALACREGKVPFLKVGERRDCLAKSLMVSAKTQHLFAKRGQAHPSFGSGNLGKGKGKRLSLEG